MTAHGSLGSLLSIDSGDLSGSAPCALLTQKFLATYRYVSCDLESRRVNVYLLYAGLEAVKVATLGIVHLYWQAQRKPQIRYKASDDEITIKQILTN